MPIDLFCSYSHADDSLRQELEKHLGSLRREGLIQVWSDRRIGPGGNWAGEIDSHLDTADVILLLVSADFLASDYCMDLEVTRALERHDRGEARVVPIILRPVDWENSRLRRLQALPPNAKPIVAWPNHDEAFRQVALGLRGLICGLEKEKHRPQVTAAELATVTYTTPPVQHESRRGRIRTAALLLVLTGLASAAWFGHRKHPPPAAKVRTNPTDGRRYVWVPPGKSIRGCLENFKCDDDERPAREITISNGFWMAQTAVTQGQYRSYAQATHRPLLPAPAFPTDDHHPAVNATWEEADQYCQWAGGRLPTEAEWEYAAWSGRPGGNPTQALQPGWFLNNSGGETHRVATQPPNAGGLYDMLGNVREWSSNWYGADYYRSSPATDPLGPPSGNMRVQRGGSWKDPVEDIRITQRWAQAPETREPFVGFRCILESVQ